MPSSTLSDSQSEKTNVVERRKSDGSSVKSEDKLLQKSGLPCYVSQTGYGPTWPPSMPQISLTAETSQMTHSSNIGGNWSTIPTTLPPNIPGSCAEIFLEPDGGGHLFVAKRLSDPDNHGNKPIKNFPKQPSQSHSHQVPETANLHRKLQRQLTLNPAYDPRLLHLGGYVERPQILAPPQDSFSIMKSPGDQPADLMQRASSQENLHLLQSNFSTIGPVPHQPLSRMGSDSRVASSLQMSSHVWENVTAEHQTVTRIASAPDSYNQWPPSARMQHLNSTSDTRLNLYPEGQMQSHHLPIGNFPEMSRHWMSHSHGLDPPRPMSSAGIQMMGTSWQEQSPSGIARGTSQVLNQPVRPSSVPPPGMQAGLMQQHQGRAASPDFSDSTRYRLYYHLASIFPKEQVETVMDLYPQETNPQKICAAILSMFPKG